MFENVNNNKGNADYISTTVTTITSNLVSTKSVFGNITKPAAVNTFSNLTVPGTVEGKLNGTCKKLYSRSH